MRDAETGEVIWSNPGNKDTGRGAAADIDPSHPGAEAWNIGGDYAWNSPVGSLNAASGEVLSTDIPAANFVTWWDGDLTREITDHDYSEANASGVPTISKWDPAAQEEVELLRLDGTLTNNTTKGNPVLQADLFGDWREELAVRLADGSGIRIYTTTDVTDARIPTLMHDSQYRVGVAGQNSAYNQPPHPSYFIGADMAEPPVASIAYVGAPALDETAPVIGGLPSGTVVADAPLQLGVTAEDAESGIRSVSVTVGDDVVAPDAAVDLAALGLYGDVTVTVTATNHAGLTSSATSSLLVVPATGATTAPGTGTLSNTSGWEYGLHDGELRRGDEPVVGHAGQHLPPVRERRARVDARAGRHGRDVADHGRDVRGQAERHLRLHGRAHQRAGHDGDHVDDGEGDGCRAGHARGQHRPEEGRELVHRDREPVVGHERDVVPVRARRRRGRVGIARRGHAERAEGDASRSPGLRRATTRSSRCSRTRTARRRRSR